MAMNIGTWMRGNARTYIGNATAMRDFRVQLRGNRSALVFGIFLVVIIGVTMVQYNSASQLNDVVSIQSALNSFYELTMGLLGAVVALVTPALTATAVVTERQRKSLDLVFSAPVHPKYYLVGKLIACYRYTWMILVLSLPVAAVSVVMGGAMWQDVLISYVLLSFHGLLFSALGLLISTLCARPVSAVLWTYMAVGAYLIPMTAAASVSRGGHEAPFFDAMSPLATTMATDTVTMIFGLGVPNWILGIAMCLALTKLLILAAGAVMSPFGGKEIGSFRVHSLVYLAVGFGSLGYWLAAELFKSGPGAVGDRSQIAYIPALFVAWTCLLLTPCIPFLSAYGIEGERRFRPNGIASLRGIIEGTPAGSLPYLGALLLTSLVAGTVGFVLAGHQLPSPVILATMGYAAALWFFLWACGRVASSYLVGVKAARTYGVAAMIILLALPLPFLIAATVFNGSTSGMPYFWDLYVLRPLIINYTVADEMFLVVRCLVDGSLLTVAGLGMTAFSERNLASRLEARRVREPAISA